VRTGLRLLLLSAAFAVATFTFGWWGVPVIAVAWALVARDIPSAARDAAFGGLVGWALLLHFASAHGPVWTLAQQLGGVMKVPTAVLVLVTLLFPALVAWSAAGTVRVMMTRRSRIP
jgi:hypothetical protein